MPGALPPARAAGRTLAWPLACGLTLRLAGAIVFGAEVADIRSYRAMAEIVLRGDNVYHYHVLFPYTPLTLPLPALSLFLARWTGASFDVAVKLWPIAADAGLIVLLGLAAWRLGAGARGAAAIAWMYALNPVAILTSAFHGNQAVLAVLLSFWACYLLAGDPGPGTRAGWPAALLLGLGIAARGFPVLLLPVFLILLPGTETSVWRPRLAFAAVALLPAALVSLPALLADAPAYGREVLSYSGFVDQGWLAIRRAWGVVAGTSGSEPVPGPGTLAWLEASKWLFLGLYGALLAWLVARRRRVSLAIGCLLTWLLFLIAYGGVSTHYLVWVIPFGLLVAWPWAIGYTLAAALAMVGFYLTWFPAVLLGAYAPATANTPEAWRVYLGGLVLSWAAGVLWWGRTLYQTARRLPGAPGDAIMRARVRSPADGSGMLGQR